MCLVRAVPHTYEILFPNLPATLCDYPLVCVWITFQHVFIFLPHCISPSVGYLQPPSSEQYQITQSPSPCNPQQLQQQYSGETWCQEVLKWPLVKHSYYFSFFTVVFCQDEFNLLCGHHSPKMKTLCILQFSDIELKLLLYKIRWKVFREKFRLGYTGFTICKSMSLKRECLKKSEKT